MIPSLGAIQDGRHCLEAQQALRRKTQELAGVRKWHSTRPSRDFCRKNELGQRAGSGTQAKDDLHTGNRPPTAQRVPGEAREVCLLVSRVREGKGEQTPRAYQR